MKYGRLKLSIIFITALIYIFSNHTFAQVFIPTIDSLHHVSNGSTEWGDYDNDGDLDVLIAGAGSLKIFRNDDVDFIEVADLTYVQSNQTRWFDFDLDNDLDIFISGRGGDNVPFTQILLNEGNDTFITYGANLPQEDLQGYSIGDFDNDGDPDIIFAGWRNSSALTILLRNDRLTPGQSRTFTQIPTNLPDFIDTYIEWLDFDKDGDLDFVLSGSNSSEDEVFDIYRNDGISPLPEWQFTEMNASLPIIDGLIATGDYDSDGFTDIVISGRNDSSLVWESRLFRNSGSGIGNSWDFLDTGIIFSGLTGLANGDMAWGDYNNDGDMDLIVSGSDFNLGNQILLYQNEGNNSFTVIPDSNFIQTRNSSVAWGDYDNDGDLDLLLSGDSSASLYSPVSKLYHNDGGFAPNSPPTIPGSLNTTVDSDSLLLNWMPASDNTTPSAGLSYNLQITSRQENQLALSPMADIMNGYRHVLQLGNAGNNLLWYITNLIPSQYSWSVQAIDNSFVGSSFSAEQNFIIKGPRFIDSGIRLTGVGSGDVNWVDYDSDNDLDLFLTGNSPAGLFSRLYKNEGFQPDSGWIFNEVNTAIQDLRESTTAWGDYDNDGDLDVIILGYIPVVGPVTELYQNEGNDIFTPQVNPAFPQIFRGSAAWGDADNDGDLDLILSGGQSVQAFTNFYLNGGSDSVSGWQFSLMNATIPASESSTLDWGDFDKDGDLDLLFSGWSLEVGETEFAAVYRNDGQLDDSSWSFTDINAGLPPVADGSTSWGDYDGDGDLDILIVNGFDGLTQVSRVYRNDGEVSGNWQFTAIAAGLPELQYGEAAWGDYDNDGDLDIAITGELVNFPTAFTGIYKNEGNDIFNLDTSITLVDALFSSLAWGDYDTDGDLDLIISGRDPNLGNRTLLYQNVGGFSPNQAPQPPSGLSAETFLDSVKLSWLPSQDDSTFDAAICYNLRLGSSPGAADIISPMSDINTGIRKILNFGNVNHNLSWTVTDLQPGTYYWAVQAIDHGFSGSQFSQESMFEIKEPYYNELALNIPGISGGNITWCDYDNDNDMDLFISGDSDSSSVVSLYNNGGFSPVSGWIFNEIPGIFSSYSSAATSWGDYDNDGDLDFILQGSMQIELYRNDGNNTFNIENTSPFTSLAGGDLAWGDMDNDGDLDLIQAGHEGLVNIGQYYRNDGIDSMGIWQFTPLNADVHGFSSGSYDLGDFDNDRDLDILWTGFFAGAFASGVIRNDGAIDDTSWSFTEIELLGGSGKAKWGDYDSDGDLDILLVGGSPQGPKFSIYRNDGANGGGGWLFVELPLGMGEIGGSDAAWGDYDNDGDLDILISGSHTSSQIPLTYLFKNEGNDIFTRDILGQFTAAKSGKVSFADFDNDGDLDIGITGVAADQSGEYKITKIYQNEGGFPANQPPQFPSGLISETFVDSVILSWQPAATRRNNKKFS